MSDPTRNPDKIEPGDTVNVVLSYHEHITNYFEGVVLYVPCATGDSWHIRECGFNGRLRYVQTFADMTLIKKAE